MSFEQPRIYSLRILCPFFYVALRLDVLEDKWTSSLTPLRHLAQVLAIPRSQRGAHSSPGRGNGIVHFLFSEYGDIGIQTLLHITLGY